MKRLLLICSLLCSNAGFALAEPSPCLIKGEGAGYYRAMYQQAELVVTGQVTGVSAPLGDLTFRVDEVLKGENRRIILLRSQRAVNTEHNGFTLPHNKPVLLFLKKKMNIAVAPFTTEPSGDVYDNVEDYNSACMHTSFIQGDRVILEDAGNTSKKEVALSRLRDFLASSGKEPSPQ